MTISRQKIKNIVLLSATIKPKLEQPKLAVTNAEVRLAQYVTALQFYKQLLDKKVIDGIVFIDNSGFPMEALKGDFTHEGIELISYDGLDYPSNYHRGYGEFKLIDYASANSRLLNGMSEEDVVWKITGRYIISNLSMMIAFLPRKFDVYVNIRAQKWVDMEVMAWKKSGYRGLITRSWADFTGQEPPELLLAKKLLKRERLGLRVVTQYLYPPLIKGVRGTDGSSFSGPLTKLKHTFRVLCKLTLMPVQLLKNS